MFRCLWTKSVGSSPRKEGPIHKCLLLEQGDGKCLALHLFDSVEDVGAAQHALSPVGRDHTYALMSGPAVGSVGTVLVADGVFAEPTKG